jgi:hypothetical protein
MQFEQQRLAFCRQPPIQFAPVGIGMAHMALTAGWKLVCHTGPVLAAFTFVIAFQCVFKGRLHVAVF